MNSSLLVIVTVLMVTISTVCGKFHFLKFSKIFSTYVRALYCVHLPYFTIPLLMAQGQNLGNQGFIFSLYNFLEHADRDRRGLSNI